MNNTNYTNNATTQQTRNSPDLVTKSETFVKNESELETIKLETVSIQVGDSRIDNFIQQPKGKSSSCQDILAIPIDKQATIQDCKNYNKSLLSNELDNNDYEGYLEGKSKKNIVNRPVPFNTMTIHGYHTQYDDYNERNPQDSYKTPRNNQNKPKAWELILSLVPPHASLLSKDELSEMEAKILTIGYQHLHFTNHVRQKRRLDLHTVDFHWRARVHIKVNEQKFEAAYPDPSIPLIHKRNLKTRNEFIKCVLIILLIMIIVTAMFIVYVLITPEVKLYFEKHGWEILLPAIILLVFADCGMICSLCARSAPWNFIFSAMTVIPMSLLAAKISAFFNTEVVLYAIMSTGFVVFFCILLACSSIDFTNWIAFVLIIAIAFAVLSIFINVVAAITGKPMRPLLVVILFVSTIFQVIMLTIQLQLILGKNRIIRIGVEDYCLAAFLLYISILDIFMRSVHIYGFNN